MLALPLPPRLSVRRLFALRLRRPALRVRPCKALRVRELPKDAILSVRDSRLRLGRAAALRTLPGGRAQLGPHQLRNVVDGAPMVQLRLDRSSPFHHVVAASHALAFSFLVKAVLVSTREQLRVGQLVEDAFALRRHLPPSSTGRTARRLRRAPLGPAPLRCNHSSRGPLRPWPRRVTIFPRHPRLERRR